MMKQKIFIRIKNKSNKKQKQKRAPEAPLTRGPPIGGPETASNRDGGIRYPLGYALHLTFGESISRAGALELMRGGISALAL